jgi:hypothetical protein
MTLKTLAGAAGFVLFLLGCLALVAQLAALFEAARQAVLP